MRELGDPVLASRLLGNTPKIAIAHYDLERAGDLDGIVGPTKALQSALHTVAEIAAANGNSGPTDSSTHCNPSVTSAKRPLCAVSEHSFSGEDRIRTCGRV